MKIGAMLDSFRLPFREGVEKAASLGVEGLQIYATDGEISPQNMTDAKIKEALDIIHSHGMVVSALFNLAEGVSSFLASKNSRFAGPAWVCSLLSLLSNGISGVSSIIRTGFSVGALSGLILSVGLALQVYVAAGKLKTSYKSAMS